MNLHEAALASVRGALPDRRGARSSTEVPALLTVDEAAHAFRCSATTIRRWLADGTLKGSKVGRDLVARCRRVALRALAVDGPSIAMIDATYGHLAPDAEDHERCSTITTRTGEILSAQRRETIGDALQDNVRWLALQPVRVI